MPKTKLKPCPICGEVPEIAYCCGEYFILPSSKAVGTCLCSSFTEMHSSEQREIEAWNKAADAVCAARSIIEVLIPVVEQAITEIKNLWEAILHTYPNKRVVWLAIHHPKERVRKKNRNRICKWLQMQYKREGGAEE